MPIKYCPGNDQAAEKVTDLNAIPAGCRLEDGSFHKSGYYANWWTSTEGGESFGQILTGTVVKTPGGILRVINNDYQYVNSYIYNKKYGLSIPCIKNRN